MPISAGQIRELLLPGLFEITVSYDVLPSQWAAIFAADEVTLPTLPILSPQMVIAMGAAAVVMKNPELSRRGLFGWLS